MPSISLMYALTDFKDPKLTVKIIGRQWYWSYEISDFFLIKKNNISIFTLSWDSYIQSRLLPRLLVVDKPLYLPAYLPIRLLITASDVIHSWSVPAFGVKMDAIPGRLNSLTIQLLGKGVFFGQCSELCGAGHGFMPIQVEILPKLYNFYYQSLKIMWDMDSFKTFLINNNNKYI